MIEEELRALKKQGLRQDEIQIIETMNYKKEKGKYITKVDER